MSQLQDEKSYVPLSGGKWGKIVVNADGTAISAGEGGGGGDASAANQDEQTTLLQTIDVNAGTIATDTANISANTPDLGQAAMAVSSPVVLASNQSAIPVTAAGTAASNAAASGNPVMVGGRYNSSNQTFDDGDVANLQSDVNGFLRNREQYQPGYEDNTNNKAIVEQRYTPTRVTGDLQIKGSAGFVHTISIAPTVAVPTAGLLTVYDSLTETGTILYSEWVFATTPGHTITLDVPAGTGIYVGYDATLAGVSCSVSWR